MVIAVWMIAIVELMRLVVQTWYSAESARNSDNLYKRFIEHLNESDRDMVKHLLQEYEEMEDEEE